MLEKSEKFGTDLTIGPRLKKFVDAGYGYDLLWAENWPEQEEATNDGRGEFQRRREWIETASLEDVFDLWLRGKTSSYMQARFSVRPRDSLKSVPFSLLL